MMHRLSLRGLASFLVLPLSLLACSGAEIPLLDDATSLPAAQTASYQDELTGLELRYPSSLKLYPGLVVGRHKNFDAPLLSSIPLEPSFEIPETPPAGELVMHVAFEGSDLAAGQSLRGFADDNLASIFYQPTGVEFDLAGKHFVELSGDTATLWVTHFGPNVFTLVIYGAAQNAQDPRVRQVAANLRMPNQAPIYIPAESRGLWSGGIHPDTGRTDVRSANAVPSMKLPFTGTRTFTGGPHTGTSNGCAATFATSTQSGVDLGMPVGTEVLATAGGTVVYSGNAGGTIGNAVGIDHGTGFSTRYWHLNSIAAAIVVKSPAVSVSQGKVLGTSGYPTAPHLHLEMRNWPANSAYPAHGISIDGYVIRVYQRISDGYGWNYQGTMTRGAETQQTFSYCSGTNNARRWVGATSTAYAGSGSITSSNTRIP